MHSHVGTDFNGAERSDLSIQAGSLCYTVPGCSPNSARSEAEVMGFGF
jgi:hypothetical protein